MSLIDISLDSASDTNFFMKFINLLLFNFFLYSLRLLLYIMDSLLLLFLDLIKSSPWRELALKLNFLHAYIVETGTELLLSERL